MDTGFDKCVLHDLYKGIIKDDDEIVLVVGDSDHLPVAEAIIEEGKKFTLVFWSNASEEMKSASESFICLDSHINTIEF